MKKLLITTAIAIVMILLAKLTNAQSQRMVLDEQYTNTG